MLKKIDFVNMNGLCANVLKGTRGRGKGIKNQRSILKKDERQKTKDKRLKPKTQYHLKMDHLLRHQVVFHSPEMGFTMGHSEDD